MERQYREIKTVRDALAVLGLRVYERFGDEAVQIIADVFYQLGLAIGGQMKESLSDNNLDSVGQAFVDAARKRGSNVDVVEKSHSAFHMRTMEGYRCAMGLEGTDRKICHAMMRMDLGIFEGATGKPIKLEIIRSLAENDSCCEMIYRLAE